MDSQLRLVEPKPIYWIPSGKTDWSMIWFSITIWSAVPVVGLAIWFGFAKLLHALYVAWLVSQ